MDQVPRGLIEDQGVKFWYEGPLGHKIKPWNHEFEKNSKMLLNIICLCYVLYMLMYVPMDVDVNKPKIEMTKLRIIGTE